MMVRYQQGVASAALAGTQDSLPGKELPADETMMKLNTVVLMLLCKFKEVKISPRASRAGLLYPGTLAAPASRPGLFNDGTLPGRATRPQDIPLNCFHSRKNRVSFSLRSSSRSDSTSTAQ